MPLLLGGKSGMALLFVVRYSLKSGKKVLVLPIRNGLFEDLPFSFSVHLEISGLLCRRVRYQ
jgi:hypothetical protein